MILPALIAPPLQAFDGSLDPAFGPGGQQPLAYPLAASDDDDGGLALLSDSLGRRIVLITRRNPFPVAASRPLELIMYRFLASGAADTSFNFGTHYRASTACVAGSVTGANHGKRVVRDPQLSGFTISAVTTTLGLREDSGRLLLAGRATVSSGQLPLLIVRLNANGDLDTSFGNPATPGYQGLNLADAPLTPSALVLDGAARYLLGGVSERTGLRRIFLARLTANGVPDASFAASGALAEYFVTPASADRALRALAIDGTKALGLGDLAGSGNRDAFWFRTGSDALFVDEFEG